MKIKREVKEPGKKEPLDGWYESEIEREDFPGRIKKAWPFFVKGEEDFLYIYLFIYLGCVVYN